MPTPDAWLRGPIEGIDPALTPAAHGLVQAGEELERALDGLTIDQLWMRPGGAASIGFHVRHVGGATDRLLAYARGAALSPDQLRFLAAEQAAGDPPEPADSLLAGARAAIDRAIDVMRTTPTSALADARTVGRARLPTSVFGLLCHISEHAQRHAGQAITTARIVKGLGLSAQRPPGA